MTYNVFSGTLNPAQSIMNLVECIIPRHFMSDKRFHVVLSAHQILATPLTLSQTRDLEKFRHGTSTVASVVNLFHDLLLRSYLQRSVTIIIRPTL